MILQELAHVSVYIELFVWYGNCTDNLALSLALAARHSQLQWSIFDK
jgi:hypothetical protein